MSSAKWMPERKIVSKIPPRGRRRSANEATTLYRLYDIAGQLLYIGIASDPLQRFREHRINKPWWGEVAHIDLVAYPDRDQAIARERYEIRARLPIRNITHSPRAHLHETT